VSKSDLAKVAGFLNALGVKPVAVDVLPGKVTMRLSDGGSLTLPADGESDRKEALENWDHVGRTNKPRTGIKAA
jgi:hypothetical protein